MLSKATIKMIRSLGLRKGRLREGLFVAEGPKTVDLMLESFEPELVIATQDWDGKAACSIERVDADKLRSLSFLQHPQQVMAILRLPRQNDCPALGKGLNLALDGVQDPGNVGTIIRIADWFGISSIFCSQDTADAFSPKVVQASMGSLAAVDVIITDLEDLIKSAPETKTVYGTFIDGDDIYSQPLENDALIVFGNEGKGISSSVGRLVNHRLLIPPSGHETLADSLNVSVSAAIVCSEFTRRFR